MATIFVRERRKVEKGEKKPRFRVVGVSGGDLKIYVEHIRKKELDQIAESERGHRCLSQSRQGRTRRSVASRNATQFGLAESVFPGGQRTIRSLLLVDDRSHVLSFQRRQDVFRMMQGVDDLELLEALGPLQQGENGTLDNEIVPGPTRGALCVDNSTKKLESVPLGCVDFFGSASESLFIFLRKMRASGGADVFGRRNAPQSVRCGGSNRFRQGVRKSRRADAVGDGR